ncbi:MAG: toprim domain-containing protein [Bacteroidota bacterium]
MLVEGYADVLSLHQEGFTNTIASSGTALTKEQLNLLSRYCKKIMISYDGDSAGLNAADRAMVLCIENGFEVNIIHLPEGEDPDSLVQTHGSQLYNKYIDEALSFVEFRIMLLKRTGSISSPPGRATAAREIVQLISKIPDRLQHDDYIRQLSSAIQINESQLLQIYKEKSRNEKNIKEKITVQPKQSNSESHEFQKISTTSKNGEKSDESFKNLFSEETLLITLSLTEPGALDLMVDKYEISSDTFFTDEAKRYFEIILHHSSDNNLVANILGSNLISETDKHFFTYIVFNKEELSEHWQKFSDRETEKDIERIIRDCVYRLEFKFLEAKKDELLKRAKNITDSAKESDILIECKKIDEQIKLLDEKYIDSNKN